MGHAGAIISGGQGTAAEKYKAMRAAGIHTVQSPADIGSTLQMAIGKKGASAASSAKKPAVKKADCCNKADCCEESGAEESCCQEKEALTISDRQIRT